MPLVFDGLYFPKFLTSLQGIDEGPEGLKLISDIIREKMGIDISVLMGANIANEVAAEKFCETTIGEGWLGPEGLDIGCFNMYIFHFWYFPQWTLACPLNVPEVDLR